jgi:hypothetical protein
MSRTQTKPKRKPRDRGPYGLSIPDAGKLIGLGKNASYDAAKSGTIPTLVIGGHRVVPKGLWLKKLGIDNTA